MAKYIDLPNLKENLTNFLNKKINPIYAKKTEIPSTVVDDALSLTSTNPVQNKVVKAEFDKVNSNLSQLELSDIAGGKNLFRNYDYMGKYAFIDETYNGYPVIYSNLQWGGAIQTDIVLKTGKTYTVSAYVKGSGEVGLYYGKLQGTVLRKTLTSDWQRAVWTFTPDTNSANTDSGSSNVRIEQTTSGETYISCFQIEEGGTATPYEPYIPSVKMLAEEVSAQKNDLSDLKDGTTPAAKAVADEDGNNIKSTYATKKELDAKANITDPVFTGSFSMGRKEGSTVGQRSHAEGNNTTASDNNAHAEGYNTTASNSNTHAEGSGTKAINANAHAEGRNTTASGLNTHAEGNNTTASGSYSHAEGSATKAERDCAHSEGNGTKASGMNSHAEGSNTTASGNSGHSEGYKTTALDYQHAGGHYNNTTTATTSTYTGTGTGTSFVIGNGTENALSNAFRINDNGEVFAKSATISTGADYAEYFEWEDENPEKEDRRGYFVTLNNKKIKLAQPGDYILGIVSGFPSVIGNGDEEWMGRYIFDDFGTPIYEEFVYEDLITGKKKTGTKWKENPDYDKERPYIQRSERPEWDAVGMLGVLSVRDDGTCVPNKYCKITDGSIATLSDDKSDYRVIRRINDNVVEIVFR